MYRIIYKDNVPAGYEYHEEGTLTEEQAITIVTYGTANPSTVQVETLEAKQKLNELRMYRDKLLIKTDHWAYQDTPNMTQAQIEYRQALRDITSQYTSLDDVVWPTEPENN